MCTRHCQVRVADVFRVERANLKPQWHCGSEAGRWGEPFSRELKSRGSLFAFSFWCLTLPWFEPLQAAREGLCSFTPAHGDMKEVACATLRGHSGTAGAGHSASRRSSKGRADNTSSPLTSLFCLLWHWHLPSHWNRNTTPQENKNCLCCSAKTFIGKVAAAPTGENELLLLQWSSDLIWHKIVCKSSKSDTSILPRVWLWPESTATAVLVASYSSRAPAVKNKTHSPPLPPHSSPHSLPLKPYLNFNSIQAQSHLAATITLISIFTTKPGIAAWSSRAHKLCFSHLVSILVSTSMASF